MVAKTKFVKQKTTLTTSSSGNALEKNKIIFCNLGMIPNLF